MYFDRLNDEFLTNLTKNLNLHGQKTFDIWSCKRGLNIFDRTDLVVLQLYHSIANGQ